jgi:hypothetical protein
MEDQWGNFLYQTFYPVFAFTTYNPYARSVARIFAPAITWDYPILISHNDNVQKKGL